MRSDENVVDVDELLEQSAWMRSLARQLVTDPHRADDIAQDAMVIAWKQRPDRRGSLRAWLGSVTRSVARQERRSEGRRSRREAIASRDEPLPSARELAEHAEAQRALMNAVSDLPETYRTVVMLRHFRDMSSAEIAAHLGVPGSTVRNRLMRALAELRSRLDRRFGGNRAAWTAPFLAWVGASSGAVSSGSVPGGLASETATGAADGSAIATTALEASSGSAKGLGAALTLEAKIAVTVAAILLCVLGLLSLRDVDDPIVVATDSPRPPAPLERIELGSTVATPSPTPDGGVWSLRGRVIDAKGMPLEGASVQVWEWEGAGGPDDPTWESVSDVDGGFALDLPDAADDVWVRAAAEGFAANRLNVVASSRLRELVLYPASRLSGVVIDLVDSRPISNARLRARWSEFDDEWVEARTEPDGSYVLEPLPRGERVSIVARAEGYPPNTYPLVVESEESRYDFAVDPGVGFAIEVYDLETHRPIAGARILDAEEEQGRGRTDASGRAEARFLSHELASSHRYRMLVLARGYCSVERRVKVPAEGQIERFYLPRTASIEGVVRDADGDSLAGVKVSYFPETFWVTPEIVGGEPVYRSLTVGDWVHGRSRRTFQTSTAADGSYRMDNIVVALREQLTVGGGNHVPLSIRMETALTPGAVGRQDFTLEPAGWVEGRVTVGGSPVETDVKVQGTHEGFETRSGPDGRFKIGGLAEGRVTIEAYYPRARSWRSDPAVTREVLVRPREEARCDFELRFDDSCIAGRVLDPDGDPVPGVVVTASSQVCTLHARDRTGADGAYRIEVLSAERCTYRVATEGASRYGVEAGTTDVDLVLSEPHEGSLRIRAVDAETGEPVLRYEVVTKGARDLHYTFDVGSLAPTGSDAANTEGVFTCGLPVGRYRLSIRHYDLDFIGHDLRDVVVDPEREAFLDVRFRRGASLEIQWHGDHSLIPDGNRGLLLGREEEYARVEHEIDPRKIVRPLVNWNSSRRFDFAPELKKVDLRKRMLQIDESGRSRLVGLRGGTYRVRSWPDDLAFTPDRIEIPEGSDTVVSISWMLKE